jgi:hypothetical protein
MKCTYNLTSRHICAATVAAEKQLVLHIVSVRVQPQVSTMQGGMCQIVIYGPSSSTVFFHIIS